jgi:hypothetical protein
LNRRRNPQKKLFKGVFGTTHVISLAKAEYVDEGAEYLIIGTGQSGMVKLSDEAIEFFNTKGCRPLLYPTEESIHVWNKVKRATIGLFHFTCRKRSLQDIFFVAFYCDKPRISPMLNHHLLWTYS